MQGKADQRGAVGRKACNREVVSCKMALVIMLVWLSPAPDHHSLSHLLTGSFLIKSLLALCVIALSLSRVLQGLSASYL